MNNPRKLFNSSNGCIRKVGVLGYMAPEILKGTKYGISADIFSCGVLIYEMIHGRMPFACNSEDNFLFDCINKSNL